MLKKTLIYTLVFIFLFSYNAYAYDSSEISALSAVAIDGATHNVLFEKDMYRQLPMASTTKIMTCLIACEYGRFEEIITVKGEMLYGTEGTLLYLKAGDRISFFDLIKGALLASGNDAANAIAFTVSKSLDGFVGLMNSKAKELKMANTCFKTPSGLDKEGHYSCAYDMAILSSEAMKNEAFRNIVKMKSAQISVNGKKQIISNHNKLLNRDGSFIGVKTGFTRKAGRCLVGAYSFRGAEIITVTLNAPDDWDDHLRLVNYAKTKYNTKIGKDEIIIPSAEGGEIHCKYSYSVNTTGNIYVKLYYYPFIYSPYKSGDTAGAVKIFSNNVLLKETEIVIM